MNTKQLKYVLVLAKEKSFSKAADALNISQPSLSQYIKKIENQVGAELFARSNGDVRLTDAGKAYVEAGVKILDIERQMENTLDDISQFKAGTLVVGTSPFRSAGTMPAAAKEFIKKYPGVKLVVREATTADLAVSLAQGEFDFCLTVLPVDEHIFSYVPILDEELLLAVPAGSPFDLRLSASAEVLDGRKYPAVHVSEIREESFVTVSETQIMQKQLQDLCDTYGLEPAPVVTVKSLDAQISMVREGIGSALVPTGIERIGGTEKVRYYSFVEKLPLRNVVAAYRKDVPLTVPARDLIAILQTI